ncbi:MAG: hypothetical protein OEL87_00150 [Nanoarchaeota archaeon]|nr:hypothetical protein [Nanoarchaeota archaeon]
MKKQVWEIIESSPMRIKEEHYISKKPYLGKTNQTGPFYNKNTSVDALNPNDLHQKFQQNLPGISMQTNSPNTYLFRDENTSGQIEFRPLVYCHDTEEANVYKCWDKVVLKWQPQNKRPSELLKILDEFGFAKE